MEIADAISKYDRVMVLACHSSGKTYTAAALVLWWYLTRSPSICLTTAPTEPQVLDLLWKEIREYAHLGLPFAPKAALIQDEVVAKHYAKGLVARDSDAFQGRHESDLLIIFDEAVGVRNDFWTGAEGMLTSGPGNKWLVIANPTDISSRCYAEYKSGNWHIIHISALDHPNLLAALANSPPPFPKAVSLKWVESKIREWCVPVASDEATVLDFEWPPDSGSWYKPGPLFESRVLGRWPSSVVNAVYSTALLDVLFTPLSTQEFLAKTQEGVPEIGCDVARFGDDYTSIHVQINGISLHHETHNGWDTSQTAGRLKALARLYAHERGVEARNIPIKIDDDGVGGGVTDKADDYTFIPCSGARAASLLDSNGLLKYPNMRSESWFWSQQQALSGLLNASHIDEQSQSELRRQLISPTWKLNERGQQTVERKVDTKRRLGRSPDDADAFNLAHARATHEGMNILDFYRNYPDRATPYRIISHNPASEGLRPSDPRLPGPRFAASSSYVNLPTGNQPAAVGNQPTGQAVAEPPDGPKIGSWKTGILQKLINQRLGHE